MTIDDVSAQQQWFHKTSPQFINRIRHIRLRLGCVPFEDAGTCWSIRIDFDPTERSHKTMMDEVFELTEPYSTFYNPTHDTAETGNEYDYKREWFPWPPWRCAALSCYGYREQWKRWYCAALSYYGDVCRFPRRDSVLQADLSDAVLSAFDASSGDWNGHELLTALVVCVARFRSHLM